MVMHLNLHNKSSPEGFQSTTWTFQEDYWLLSVILAVGTTAKHYFRLDGKEGQNAWQTFFLLWLSFCNTSFSNSRGNRFTSILQIRTGSSIWWEAWYPTAGDNRSLVEGRVTAWPLWPSPLSAMSCFTAMGQGGGGSSGPPFLLHYFMHMTFLLFFQLTTFSLFWFVAFCSLSGIVPAPELTPSFHSGHWPNVSWTGRISLTLLPPHPHDSIFL